MINAVSFGVLASVTLKITFWHVTPCTSVRGSQRFADIRCLHLQDRGLSFQSVAAEVYSEINENFFFFTKLHGFTFRKVVIFLVGNWLAIERKGAFE